MLRVYLTGQKAFGASVLALCQAGGCTVTGVSAPLLAGDGRSPDRLRAAADEAGIAVLPPGALTAATLPPGTDVILAAHSPDFLSRPVRTAARLGALGYHPSLLPLHRGRDAVRWAVHMRERVTGGSVFWLNDTVDGGDLAAQAWCHIRPDDTAESLWRRELYPMGLRLLAGVLLDLHRGVIRAVPQDPALATWEPSWTRPPLYRPDLPQLGTGRNGYTVVRAFAESGAARA